MILLRGLEHAEARSRYSLVRGNPQQRWAPDLPTILWTQPERVAKVNRITAGKAIQVEAAGEAKRIFLRKTPDRPCVVGPERRKPQRFFSLAAPVSPRLVVKATLDPEVHFQGGVASGGSVSARLPNVSARCRGAKSPTGAGLSLRRR